VTDLRTTIEDVGDWRSVMAAAGHRREEYAGSGRPHLRPTKINDFFTKQL
jgi:hypothetical protein